MLHLQALFDPPAFAVFRDWAAGFCLRVARLRCSVLGVSSASRFPVPVGGVGPLDHFQL